MLPKQCLWDFFNQYGSRSNIALKNAIHECPKVMRFPFLNNISLCCFPTRWVGWSRLHNAAQPRWVMFVSFLRGLRGKARSEVGPLQPCSGLRLLRGWTHHKSVRAYTQGRRDKLDLNNRRKHEKYILTYTWEACCLWQKCLCVDVKYKLVGSRRRRRRRTSPVAGGETIRPPRLSPPRRWAAAAAAVRALRHHPGLDWGRGVARGGVGGVRGVHRVEDHVYLLLWQDKVHAGALPGTLRPHRLAYLQFCLSDQKWTIIHRSFKQSNLMSVLHEESTSYAN